MQAILLSYIFMNCLLLAAILPFGHTPRAPAPAGLFKIWPEGRCDGCHAAEPKLREEKWGR
jgi:hypothetical protein